MDAFVFVLLVSTLRITVPYVLASLGGFFSERSGVVNIALEGLLLTGAFAGLWAAHAAEGMGVAAAAAAWLGVAAAVVAGTAMAGVHAFVTVRLGADQIVSGLAVNLLAAGGTKFLLTLLYGSAANSPRIGGVPEWPLPLLQSWGLTRVLFCTPLVFLALACVVVAHGVAARTVFGLRLHAAGEHPEAAAAAGIAVQRLRWQGVLLSGALAGLGGAWLVMDQHQFTAGMANGRGYIALAALIFGKWRPGGAALACLLFGAAEALQIQLQARTGQGVPTQFVQMLPYVVTMVALAGVIGRSRPPAALGRPLED